MEERKNSVLPVYCYAADEYKKEDIIMNEFVFTYPTKVYFGQNSLEKALRAELNRHGKTVMLAYGGASLKKNGIYDRVKELLAKDGKEVVDFRALCPTLPMLRCRKARR